MIRNILVTGSSGKQGGALVRYLAAESNFRVFAVTRNEKSTAALASSAMRNVTVVQGDPKSPVPIFDCVQQPIYGVFSVTVPGKDEEQQAMRLIEESVSRGVQHFVFTSADRGGPLTSDLIAACAKSSMEYTILRPTAFYDNLTPDFFGKMFARTLTHLEGIPVNMISSNDVGIIAGKVFERPEKYQNSAYSLVSEQLTISQIDATFRKVVGKRLSKAPAFLESVARYMVVDYGKMIEFFSTGAYTWDPASTRNQFDHETQSFEQWLKRSSKFVQVK